MITTILSIYIYDYRQSSEVDKMSDFVIIPDSSSDLTKELRDRFRIPECIRGIVYFPDGHEELSDIDWEKYDPKTFYNIPGLGEAKERAYERKRENEVLRQAGYIDGKAFQNAGDKERLAYGS